MFVRKGTVRKARGGSNRRSTRRPRRDSNGASTGTSRKSVVSDEHSSSSVGHRLTPNGEHEGIRSTSSFSIGYEDDIRDNGSVHSGNISVFEERQPPVKVTSYDDSRVRMTSGPESVRYQSEVAKPSPSRSQATTVVVGYLYFFIPTQTSEFFIICKYKDCL